MSISQVYLPSHIHIHSLPLIPHPLSDDGEVYTWGSETHLGQMGYYSEDASIPEPRSVPDLLKGVSPVILNSRIRQKVLQEVFPGIQ